MTQEPVITPNIPIRTVCRDCIFAIYDEKTQTGCKFGRLQQYKKWGVPIEEVTEGKLKFKAIEALCCFARANSWEHHDKPDAMALARAEATVSFDCIIMADEIDFANELTNHVDVTVKSAKDQVLPFKRIVLAVEEEKPMKAIKYGIEVIGDKVDWEVVHIMPDNELTYFEKLDEAVGHCHSSYYCIFEPGFKIPSNWTHQLDKANNDYLHRFIMVKGDIVETVQRDTLFYNRILSAEEIKELYESLHNYRYNGLTMQTNISKMMDNFGMLGVIQKFEDRLKDEIEEGDLTECKREQLLTTMEVIRAYQ